MSCYRDLKCRKLAFFVCIMEMVLQCYIFNGQYKCKLKKRFLRVLYFTFLKKEYHIQIKQRQAPSHQSYSAERKLKLEHLKRKTHTAFQTLISLSGVGEIMTGSTSAT